MCGIIGYVGPREALPILLEGLGRLEYRGYDSAGVATVTPQGHLEVRRAVGKLSALARALEAAPLAGRIGIGHTRWATHGRPSEENAHPHRAGPVAVIHNGIIENYVELRDQLRARRHRLRSETDSELISHLVEEGVKSGLGLAEAVRRAVAELRGSFSVVVLSQSEPDRLVAAKSATPLIVGLGEGESFVASDIPALLGHTRRVVVLEDGEIVELTSQGARFMSFDGRPLERAARVVEWDPVSASKGGFKHYLRKEIAEQPQAWIDTLGGRIAPGSGAVRFETELWPQAAAAALERIVIVGAGASWIASLIGKFIIEELCQVPVEVDYAAEFRYRRAPLNGRTLMVGVSQSGETADTLAAMEEGRARGCHLIALTNTVDSSLARRADAQLYTRCGPEISVTTTKCFLTQIEAFYLFALHFAAALGRLSESEAAALVEPLRAIPQQIEAVIGREREIVKIARKYGKARDFLYLGRGISYPVALEGALKLKEISYIHAEGYSAGEMKHGPIALIDQEMPVVVIIPNDHLFDKTVSNLKEVESREGRVIAVTDHPTEELRQVAYEVIEVPSTHRLLSPVLTTVPLQLLAYHIAVYRGTDVDQPRNLAKSVTVE
ncbi:MAG: glutamine--fructose-6-phosphate transaminase (isomerizing) [Deltaproteobacteria bacterium]|jgi:glucosamine--fructose-6-phosphate aminotransferase (isomerizing)|nr:glutamine--fructose-6-phosphate transaminase (isomerizing) [Deltaproteobacteria bacterium]